MAAPAQTTALVPATPTTIEHSQQSALSPEQVDLIKRTICKDATDDELSLFINTSRRLGLDPFARQIHAVKRWDSKAKREVMAIQVGIDGFRVAAGRTGELDGQEGPFWCGEDGVWHDVWLKKEAPAASKVLVFRRGCSRPFVGVATYLSYVQRNKEGAPNAMWSRGPDFMLAKCAEAVALRKGFPERLSGVYAPEELPVEEPPIAPAAAVGPMPPQSSHVAPTKPASSPATSTTTSGTKAAPPSGAKNANPPMTDADKDEMKVTIQAIWNKLELAKLATTKIATANMTDAQRAELRQVYEDQLDLIDQAAREDAEAGQ